MRFDVYQQATEVTLVRNTKKDDIMLLTRLVLGLSGESGEVAEKIKKILRDKNGKIDEVTIQEIKKELGDVLWYVARIAGFLGLSMADIARENIRKLFDRKARNKIIGKGDNR